MTAREWFDATRRKPKGLRALDRFVREFGDWHAVPGSATLLDRIVTHLYAVDRFGLDAAPERTDRMLDRDALAEFKAAAVHAQALAQLFEKHGSRASLIPFDAVLAERHGAGIDLHRADGRVEGRDRLMADLFDALAVALEGPIPLVGTGPVMHRFAHGPFIYVQPIDDPKRRALPDKETMALFGTVFWFRLHDMHGGKSLIAQVGQPMPETGQPRWNLAWQLVDAFLLAPDEKPCTDGEIRKHADRAKGRISKFIQENPGIGFDPTFAD